MEKGLAGLLAAMQEAVIAAKDGRVALWNAPAEACFPGLSEGADIAELFPEGEDGAVFGAGNGAVTVSRWEGYTLYTVPVRWAETGLLSAAGAEMREALNVMGLAIDRSEAAARQGEGPGERHAALMHRGYYRLLRLADHLSLLGEGELYLQRREFDLAARLAELSRSAEIHTGRTVRYEGPESLRFYGDGELLGRMYLNLLSNVLKYAPEGEILLQLKKRGGRVTLTVADRGTGMAREEMRSALAGTGGKTAASRPEQGAGMGLAVVRKIAGAHGGTVMLESRPGSGTRAVVSLPLQEPPVLLCSSEDPYAVRSTDPVLEELSDVLDWKAYRYFRGD